MLRRYGASPVHLLAHLALLPIVAWALLTVLDFRAASNVVLWLVGAVILHDLVLLPAYSALDRVARVPLRGAINHVRVPAGLSLLTLLGYENMQAFAVLDHPGFKHFVRLRVRADGAGIDGWCVGLADPLGPDSKPVLVDHFTWRPRRKQP